MKNRRRPTPVGIGRIAPSAPQADARRHRNPQAAQASSQLYGDGLDVDDRGRIRVKVGEDLPLLTPSTVTLEDLASAYNELLQRLRGTR